MDRDEREDIALEKLFDAARTSAPEPSDSFLARLAADADNALPRTEPVERPAKPLFPALGVFFAASGLSGAAALGVWIGFVMPDILNLDSLTPFATDAEPGIYAFLPGADLTGLAE